MADGGYDEVNLGSGIWLKSCQRCGALVRDPRFGGGEGVKTHDAWHLKLSKVLFSLAARDSARTMDDLAESLQGLIDGMEIEDGTSIEA